MGDEIEDDGKITVGGDEVSGMAGNEEVYGKANVANNHVTFGQKKRITGLYSEDPLPTWSWTNGYGHEGSPSETQELALGQMDSINKMTNLEDYGVRDGEDLGLKELTMGGVKIDLSQTEAEK